MPRLCVAYATAISIRYDTATIAINRAMAISGAMAMAMSRAIVMSRGHSHGHS